MTACCPHCGGTGKLPDSNAAVMVERLRADCIALGIAIGLSGSITESDLGKLLGRSAGTLRNWRLAAQPIQFHKIGGRIRYRLEDVADYLATQLADHEPK